MKILMAAMSLDIGGAETHIVELSKELVRRGASVTVASNGGVFVSELEAAGIRHIKAPLNRKGPLAVLRSVCILGALIKKERFDVVHAHARIPGFICGLLQKKLRFRFVTTCHGVFKITPYWKLFSNWGERALAVSCDIKQYLIKNYGMNSDSISLTVNGIDLGRFGWGKKASAASAGHKLHRIAHVSRIDRESSAAAFQLAEAAPELAKLYPDFEIVVAGAGTAFDELKAAAAAANKKAGREVVILAGATDVAGVAELLDSAEVFVGVSRAALEAMAASLPLILAGAQGYLGVFGPANIGEALETNFCCRGFEASSAEKIKSDIIKIFEMTEEERRASGEYNRSVVGKYYTVARMADDAEAVYRSLTPYEYYKYGEVVISGYYGFGNTGDDSLLSVIVSELRRRRPELRITVLTKRPRQIARLYGVKAVGRLNPFAIYRALRRAKLLISGSGNLIQNITSNRSLYYYLAVMGLARRFGLKIMMYASGIGPLGGKKSRASARDILNLTDVITLRESDSAKELVRLGVTVPVTVTADPAFCIAPADAEWVDFIMGREGIKKGGGYFAVALRAWKDAPPEFYASLVSAVNEIKAFAGTPVFIPMQLSKDLAACRRAAAATGGKVAASLTASELIGLIGHMSFTVAMRLHAAVYSAVAGTPFIGLAYDMKIEALLSEFNLPYNIGVSSFKAETLVSMARSVMENREAISSSIKKISAEKLLIARSDAQKAVSLL